MYTDGLSFTVCCMCGKQFINRPGSIYHVTFAGLQNWCCSYTCYTKAKETKNQNSQPEYVKYRKSISRS